MSAVGHFFELMFRLPEGSIWSNLVASLIWGAVVSYAAMIVHSRNVVRLDKRFAEHKEHMETQLAAHLQEIKDHIDGSQGSS